MESDSHCPQSEQKNGNPKSSLGNKGLDSCLRLCQEVEQRLEFAGRNFPLLKSAHDEIETSLMARAVEKLLRHLFRNCRVSEEKRKGDFEFSLGKLR